MKIYIKSKLAISVAAVVVAVVGCGIWDPGGLGDDALTVHCCSVQSQQIGPNNTIIKVKGKFIV